MGSPQKSNKSGCQISNMAALASRKSLKSRNNDSKSRSRSRTHEKEHNAQSGKNPDLSPKFTEQAHRK